MFEELRESLIESYKPRAADEVACISCGTASGKFAFHVIEYSHSDATPAPSNLVRMSSSRGFVRGSAILCQKCCPACSSCGLPISSLWIDKMVHALSQRYPQITFRRGNGHCRNHIHPMIDLRAFWRKPIIKEAPEVALRRLAPQSSTKVVPAKPGPRPAPERPMTNPRTVIHLGNAPISSELELALRQACRRLEQVGGGSIVWLRNSLLQPFIEHLSFRVASQIFFVHLDLGEPIEPPPDFGSLAQLADYADGVACRLPMQRSEHGFQLARPGWGLVHALDDTPVDVEREATRQTPPMSDWEVHDLSVQIVCNGIEKAGGRVTARSSYPTVDPSIWYEDKDGRAWVVVRSTRYPNKAAPRPDNLASIRNSCLEMSLRGYFASVALAGQGATMPRGGGVYASFHGLEPLS
ncbi:MAG: hypothetical protein U1F60_02990 [Planctomycetota bacterium]